MTVVGYCRLSRDEDKENFISIEEQKRIIKDYAKSRNWNLKDDDFYIDDNISGYTFNRPAFSKMMKKVKIGEIDVVIVKDLSRIGRHNGRVLVLIDEFKNMQKNLIAVSEMGGTYDVLNWLLGRHRICKKYVGSDPRVKRFICATATSYERP